jgi:hypothetical protein
LKTLLQLTDIRKSFGAVRALKGVSFELLEGEVREAFRHGVPLRVDQLQLMASGEDHRRGRFGAHADPVDPRRRGLGAVGLHRDPEPLRVERLDHRGVELEEGFAAGAYYQGAEALRR